MDAKHICRNIANNLNFHTSIIVYINILNYDKYQKTRVNKSELIFPFAQFIITKLRYEYCSRLEKNKNLGALGVNERRWNVTNVYISSPISSSSRWRSNSNFKSIVRSTILIYISRANIIPPLLRGHCVGRKGETAVNWKVGNRWFLYSSFARD